MKPVAVAAALVVAAALAVVYLNRTPSTPAEQAAPTVGATPSTSTSASETPLPTAGGRDELPETLALLTENWLTNWSVRSIDLEELDIGIRVKDPRDRIPPIDDPDFVSVAEAGDWPDDREPGIALTVAGTSRFYPLSILTRHEIVNDVVEGRPVAVTFCPLCNTGIAFDRELDGVTYRFGVSGLLRNSDLVMWDDQTQSLWQQITGEAIVGDLTGTRLPILAAPVVSWGDFKAGFPDGELLSQNQGFGIQYGLNPYVGYSTSARPFLFSGEIDDRFPALERVVGVTIGDASKAYPFSVISQERAVNDTVGGTAIVVFWGSPDTADALDGRVVADSQAIGSGVAYSRTVDGQVLTFSPLDDSTFVDAETNSEWDMLGRAVSGPLQGTRLDPVVHRNEFWFAWQAFFSDAPVYGQ